MHNIKIKTFYATIIFASLGWQHTSCALMSEFQKEVAYPSKAIKMDADQIVKENLQTASKRIITAENQLLVALDKMLEATDAWTSATVLVGVLAILEFLRR